MEKCQICNIDLYHIISFENIFKNKQETHKKCLEKLEFNIDRIALPIINNYIYYDYAFCNLDSDFNIEYLELKYLGNIVYRNMKTDDWSILLFYSENLFEKFNHNDFLIFFSLSKVPFLFISLIEEDISFIFHNDL